MSDKTLVDRLREPVVKMASDGFPYIDHRDCADLFREAADRIEAWQRAFVRLAVPTRALLMDQSSHKYVSPEILNEWEHALVDGEALGCENTAKEEPADAS